MMWPMGLMFKKKTKNFCPPFELSGNCINKGCLRLSVFYTRVKNLD